MMQNHPAIERRYIGEPFQGRGYTSLWWALKNSYTPGRSAKAIAFVEG